jgi:hypothetical protein
MDENRERQLERDVEDTSPERLEEEQIERSSQQTSQRVDKEISENRAPADVVSEQLEPLFEDEAAKKFRSRWLVIQSKFVDDPRDSVKQADDLVADILKSVTMSFADRRISLEKQWNSGENISTEDMRQALKRYRAFFERLLTLET